MNEPLSFYFGLGRCSICHGDFNILLITPKQRHHLNYVKYIFVAFENKQKGSLRDQNFENDVIMYATMYVRMYIFVKGAENKRH